MLAVILVIVGLFGVIGNAIAISILNRRDMESPNNFILKGTCTLIPRYILWSNYPFPYVN